MALSFPTLQAVEHAARALGDRPGRRVEIVGPWSSGKTLLAVQLARARGVPLLIAAPGRADADAIHEDLCSFLPEEQCLLFPAWEVLPTDAMEPADDIVAERMNVLMRLSEALEQGAPVACVAPVQSLLQRVARRTRLQEQSLTLRVGDEQAIDALLLKLIELGYERELMVERRGQMSLRGGIFDIFPIASELPLRIEFFGDEIESIRRFEPETQRSVGRADRVRILPRSEKRMLQQGAEGLGLGTLFDYLPDSALIALDEPARLAEEAETLSGTHADSPYFVPWEALEKALDAFSCVSLAQVALGGAGTAPRIAAPMRSITGWERDRQAFWDQLTRWDADGYRVRIFCANTGERRRLHELLEEQGYRPGQDAFDLKLELGRLRGGFVSPADKLTVLSEREMFGRHYVRRQRRRFEAGATITSFDDLKAGDYIVHSRHGIGRYLGLRRFEGKAGDFLALQYSGGDRLYLPVTHIDEVQKYVAGEGAAPRIDKLGGSTWARKKARVKKAVRDMTEELLKLYAAREARDGHAFAKDTHWQEEFEDAFEYEETPDQARAILEVKRDMEAPKPMERLLCGDVGFGKTEVAIRAAFRAVLDGKQVAVLVPTTVLAQQHYTNFGRRLAAFPVTVAMLSRFQTPMLRLLKRLAAPFRFLPWDSLEGRIRSGIAGLDVLFRPRELFLLLLRSLLIWTLIAASYHFGMAALFTPPAFQAALLAMCLTVVGLMAVAAPAGIGAVHGAIVLALSLFGVPVDQGLAFALLYHALVTTLNVALGLVGTHALGLRPGRLLRLSARRGADSPDEAAPR